ncbi:MAG: type VI secretion protein IcmF/TssM N-terminal domain-containing protein, partial [Planctomycetota bacterium]
MQNLLSSKRLLATLGIGAFTLFGGLFYWFRAARQSIWWLLLALVILGVMWLATHYIAAAIRRRKQRKFDAGVAAKEGIDDRKREWGDWTEELHRQGIDRYELPFYLLVGEPQSGKSVLLQNSDLHFPFGQTRLSGIGGTRGCDWWFTEEAVILDLAGRLFTHEGGASDEAEWEAFLELLSDFRPLCPANGVILVIPCDSLIEDSREEASRKADHIKDALLTLTGKLQAQLPIYVALTKGDRIFGFAESVHRLDAEKRHEMFGWSRPGEGYDAPFDMKEVREGFGAMVNRARLLRDTMLASARLPEALPEVDRMYAFPEELEGIFSMFEIYLKRVFSESTLVDRLFFRGFYLTSGLQSGAPIAKICAEIVGSTGEADKRNLEALFTKQQAYFIKDLIRRRVFSERGLVRPTEGRVVRARRSAWIGYGAAAALALVSLIWSLVYVFTPRGELDQIAVGRAFITADLAADHESQPDRSRILGALTDVRLAAEASSKEHVYEDVYGGLDEDFKHLYRKLFDLALLPVLRQDAEIAIAAAVDREPRDHREFLAQIDQVQTLMDEIDAGNEIQFNKLISALAQGDEFQQLEQARRTRTDYSGKIPPSRPLKNLQGRLEAQPLRASFESLSVLWDRTLNSGDLIQIEGDLGYVVAWRGIEEGRQGFLNLVLPRDRERVHVWATTYHRSIQRLASQGAENVLSRTKVLDQLSKLSLKRTGFLGAGGTPAADRTAWLAADGASGLKRFIEKKFRVAEAGFDEDLNQPTMNLSVPTEQLKVWLADEAFSRVCNPTVLSAQTWTPEGIEEDLRTGLRSWWDADSAARLVFRAKCLVMQDTYQDEVRNWRELAARLGLVSVDPPRMDSALVLHLKNLTALLVELDGGQELFQPWRSQLDYLRDSYQGEVS